jgi:hypothetical protein
MNSVATPNLKAFAEQAAENAHRDSSRAMADDSRLPNRGPLFARHHKTLHLDGIEMPYSTLCRIVTILQRDVQPKADRVPKQPTAPDRPGERSVKPAPVDPLRNLRRLSEHRPGFEYSGTLPDEELFGPR